MLLALTLFDNYFGRSDDLQPARQEKIIPLKFDLKTKVGLEALNSHLEHHSYIDGYTLYTIHYNVLIPAVYPGTVMASLTYSTGHLQTRSLAWTLRMLGDGTSMSRHSYSRLYILCVQYAGLSHK